MFTVRQPGLYSKESIIVAAELVHQSVGICLHTRPHDDVPTVLNGLTQQEACIATVLVEACVANTSDIRVHGTTMPQSPVL